MQAFDLLASSKEFLASFSASGVNVLCSRPVAVSPDTWSISSERGTAFCAVSGDRKKTTYAFVSWRVADSLGVEPVRYTVSRRLMAIRSLLSCYAL